MIISLMNIAYFNGKFLPKDEIKISPDDRGFLFADGIYEVMKWYGGFFYDIDSHVVRMKRSLKETRIIWPEEDSFPVIANELINLNNISDKHALIYLQVTRGAAPRTHNFPDPEVSSTVYSFVKEIPVVTTMSSGVKVMLKKDIRWTRCDIKSVALLANTLSFQEAHEKGLNECVFVRDGLITEGSRSNIFFVRNGKLYTHPESDHILSGVTRKNILRIAREAGIQVIEEAVPEKRLGKVQEAFTSNTSAEVTPVIALGEQIIGNGKPGPVTMILHKIFNAELAK
jgi:D-alanine transaminase